MILRKNYIMTRKLKLPLLYVSRGLTSSALPLLFLLKIIRPSANNKIVKKNWVGLMLLQGSFRV